MKITIRGIIAILLILLAFVMVTTTQTGFSLGDKILLGLGISPLSNGQTGFHYTLIIFFVLFTIGVMEARRAVSGVQLIILILLLSLLSPSILTSIEPIYFRMHSGLSAVEYDSRNTQFTIRSSDDKKNLEIIGAIALTNYGSDPIKLGIKIPSEGAIQREWFSHDLILTVADSSAHPEIFTLHPGERRTILTYSTIPLKNDFNGQSSMSGPKLILFTDNETRVVGYNL